MDVDLEGHARRKFVYLVGGSWMTYEELRGVTKDIDFIMSRPDFVALSGIIADIECNWDIRIDIFPDGQLSGYAYPTYAKHAVKLPVRYQHLNLLRVDDIGFLVMKALAGRDKDKDDIDVLASRRGLPHKNEVITRFGELTFEEGSAELFKDRFDSFLRAYYAL